MKKRQRPLLIVSDGRTITDASGSRLTAPRRFRAIPITSNGAILTDPAGSRIIAPRNPAPALRPA